MLKSLFLEASTKEKSTKVFGCEGVGKHVKSDRKPIGFLLLLMRILFTPVLPKPNCHFEPPHYTFQKVHLCRLI